MESLIEKNRFFIDYYYTSFNEDMNDLYSFTSSVSLRRSNYNCSMLLLRRFLTHLLLFFLNDARNLFRLCLLRFQVVSCVIVVRFDYYFFIRVSNSHRTIDEKKERKEDKMMTTTNLLFLVSTCLLCFEKNIKIV